MTNKDYERLTFRPSNSGEISGVGLKANSEEIAERLYALEEMIENGTLVLLPCKVGDTVYFVNYRFGKSIEPYIVDRITITSNKIVFDTHQVEEPHNLGLIYSDSFGKSAFFTKETAEMELKERIKCQNKNKSKS